MNWIDIDWITSTKQICANLVWRTKESCANRFRCTFLQPRLTSMQPDGGPLQHRKHRHSVQLMSLKISLSLLHASCFFPMSSRRTLCIRPSLVPWVGIPQSVQCYSLRACSRTRLLAESSSFALRSSQALCTNQYFSTIFAATISPQCFLKTR